MHPLDPLNGSKTRLIDVHAEAFALDVIGVASGRIIVIDKLSTAFDADVILLTFFSCRSYGYESLHTRDIAWQITPNSYPHYATPRQVVVVPCQGNCHLTGSIDSPALNRDGHPQHVGQMGFD